MPYKNPDSEAARQSRNRRARAYAAKHPDKIKQNMARWRARNRDGEVAKARERREILKATGRCIWCAELSDRPGKVHCSECAKKQQKCYRSFRIRHPEHFEQQIARQRHDRYRLTVGQFNAMRERQNFCCAICGKHEQECKKALHVDHDHITGYVRGLLCSVCNHSLHLIEKDMAWGEKAVAYLKQYEDNKH